MGKKNPEIRYSGTDRCKLCDGGGYEVGDQMREGLCHRCGGSGREPREGKKINQDGSSPIEYNTGINNMSEGWAEE
jgi:DnaJ-class molecular chaperone